MTPIEAPGGAGGALPSGPEDGSPAEPEGPWPLDPRGDNGGTREVAGIIIPPAEVGYAGELAGGTIDRAFGGDPQRLQTFVAALRPALPPGTVLVLRGSVVAGRSFRTGEPFDALGPGTSDLDVVVVGDDARDLFAEEAQLLGGINTLPLSDDTAWVAPGLEVARRRAQAVARRPVSIQAMAGWFLDLRSRVQGQPYVILAPDG
jgi:hypothetical protein